MYTFSSCEALKILEIEEGVTTIGREAFSGCWGLISITLPKTLTTVGSNAFYGGEALIEIINHSNLSVGQGTSIGSNAKMVHSGKSLIEQDEDGFLFYNEQGIKYLVGYIGLETTLALPSDFAYQLYSHAFYANRRLVHVSIPDGVSIISEYAFDSCKNLMTLEIPQTVTQIHNYAFYGCSKLERIFYGGTETTAEGISVAQGNELLEDIECFYYSEQTPTQEGNYWHYVNGVPTEWKVQS